MRWAQAGVAAFLVTIPVSGVWVGGWTGHDLARAAELPLMLLCAAAGCTRALQLPPAAGAVVGLAGLLAAVSIAAAAQPAMALREAALFLGMAAVAACVADGPAGARRVARAAAAALALYAAATLLVALAAVLASAAPSRMEMLAGYDNPRFLSHVLTAALPIALAVGLDPDNGVRWRRLAHLALVAGAALAFISAGRATVLALVVAALAALLCHGRAAWPVAARLLAALAAGALVFAVMFLLLPVVVHGHAAPAADYSAARLGSDEARGYLWRLAWQQIESAPWFGVGPMHYAHLPNAKAAHPHNIVLQLAAEWGLPMAALASASAGAALLRLARRLRRLPSADPRTRVGIALSVGLVAVAVDGMASGNFVMPASQVWIAVLAGLSLAWWRACGEAQRRPGAGQGRFARGLALSILTVLWLAFVPALIETRGLAQRMLDAQKLHPTERIQPRFWSSGRF